MSFLALLVVLYFSQERIIFLAEKLPPNYKYSFATEFQEKDLVVDGVSVNGLLFRARQPKGMIVFFHGNAGTLDNWGAVGEDLVEATSYDVWMIDYPGYGKSGGKVTSEEQLHRIAQATLDAARKENRGEKMLIFGRSIGSGFAVRLAAENSVSGLILETPYDSFQDLVSTKMKWVPGFLVKYPLRSDLWIVKVRAPILILHGTQDETIPYSQGRRLAERVPRAKLVTIQDGHHNTLAREREYWKGIEEFLSGI